MANSEAVGSKLNELFTYLQDFLVTTGYPPSVREICKDMNIKSTATVYDYLNRLEAQGKIRKGLNKNRAIELIGVTTKCPTRDLPLIGNIAAGSPILAQENIEGYYSIPTEFLSRSGELFMLNIRGDSMINAGINDGDIVIIRKQSTAENGDIVAANIDGAETLKKFYKEKNQYRLKPENDRLSDIIVDNVDILGILTGLIRKY